MLERELQGWEWLYTVYISYKHIDQNILFDPNKNHSTVTDEVKAAVGSVEMLK